MGVGQKELVDWALMGMAAHRKNLDDEMSALLILRQELEIKPSRSKPTAARVIEPDKRSSKRKISAAARAKIRAAQKKRWALYRKRKALEKK